HFFETLDSVAPQRGLWGRPQFVDVGERMHVRLAVERIENNQILNKAHRKRENARLVGVFDVDRLQPGKRSWPYVERFEGIVDDIEHENTADVGQAQALEIAG